MVLIRRRSCLWCVLALVAAAGCRDVTPPAAYSENLGDEDTVLIPVHGTSVAYNAGEGSATWQPFRELDAEAEVEDEDEDAAEEGEAGGLEAEIRELIAEYNEIAADGEIDELVVYYVDEQQETLEALLQTLTAMDEKLEAAKTALEEKLPDASERITTIFTELERMTDFTLDVGALTVVSEGEVTGEIKDGGSLPTCRFVLIDEEWFIEVPGLPSFATLEQGLTAISTTFDTVAQGVRSEQVPAEAALAQLEIIAQAAAAQRGGDAESSAESD